MRRIPPGQLRTLGEAMSKKRAKTEVVPSSRGRKSFLAISLVAGLIAVGGMFSHLKGLTLSKEKAAQIEHLAPSSFNPNSPSKEYIYAGGRLVATEEPGSTHSCSFSISPSSQSFTSSGGAGIVNVMASPGCSWTATSNTGFIAITSSASGSGNGTINYSVAQNTSASTRTGTMTIAGQTFTVTQSGTSGGGCSTGIGTGLKGEYFNNMVLTGSPVLTRTDANIDFNWSTGSPAPALSFDQFSVRWTGQVQAACSEAYKFYVFSDDGVRLWINNQSVAIINAWFDQFGPERESEPINLIAGQKYDIRLEYYENQAGAEIHLRWSSPSTPKQAIPQSQLYLPATSCSFSIDPSSQGFAATGGAGSVDVMAGPGCNWTATSNASFITITSSASGSGNGTINYSVTQNTSTSQRTGTMTIAGQTFTVTQAGSSGGGGTPCQAVTITPGSRTVNSSAASYSFTLNGEVPDGCSWLVTSNASWLTITSTSGSGSATVTYSVTQNTSGTTRQGFITVTSTGQRHSVKQSP
jgi:hypothetical protein